MGHQEKGKKEFSNIQPSAFIIPRLSLFLEWFSSSSQRRKPGKRYSSGFRIMFSFSLIFAISSFQIDHLRSMLFAYSSVPHIPSCYPDPNISPIFIPVFMVHMVEMTGSCDKFFFSPRLCFFDGRTEIEIEFALPRRNGDYTSHTFDVRFTISSSHETECVLRDLLQFRGQGGNGQTPDQVSKSTDQDVLSRRSWSLRGTSIECWFFLFVRSSCHWIGSWIIERPEGRQCNVFYNSSSSLRRTKMML